MIDSIRYSEDKETFILQVWILREENLRNKTHAYLTIQVDFSYPNAKEFSFTLGIAFFSSPVSRNFFLGVARVFLFTSHLP